MAIKYVYIFPDVNDKIALSSLHVRNVWIIRHQIICNKTK